MLNATKNSFYFSLHKNTLWECLYRNLRFGCACDVLKRPTNVKNLTAKNHSPAEIFTFQSCLKYYMVIL